MEGKEVAVNVTGWSSVSGTRVLLALDPRERQVYDWYCVGAGMPYEVFLHKDAKLVDVPTDAHVPSLAAWLKREDNQRKLAEICETFVGVEWDGSNHRGQWTDEAFDLVYDFAQAFRDHVSDGTIARKVDASEYLYGQGGETVRTLLTEMQRNGETTLRGFTDSIETECNGWIVDPDELHEQFAHDVDEWADSNEDDEDDDAERQALVAYARTLEGT